MADARLTDTQVEMLRLADDLEAGEIGDLDTGQTQIITRALRVAARAPAQAADAGS